jgi:hypothetical protein
MNTLECFWSLEVRNKAGVSQKTAAKTQIVVTGITSQYNTLQHLKGREQKYTAVVILGVTETQYMAKQGGCSYRMKVNALHLFVG